MADWDGNLSKRKLDCFDGAVIRSTDCGCGDVQGVEGVNAGADLYLSMIVTGQRGDSGAMEFTALTTATTPAELDGAWIIVETSSGCITDPAPQGACVWAKKLDENGLYNLAIQTGAIAAGDGLDITAGYAVASAGTGAFTSIESKTVTEYSQIAAKFTTA